MIDSVTKDRICSFHIHDVLDHFLAQIMVDAIYLHVE